MCDSLKCLVMSRSPGPFSVRMSEFPDQLHDISQFGYKSFQVVYNSSQLQPCLWMVPSSPFKDRASSPFDFALSKTTFFLVQGDSNFTKALEKEGDIISGCLQGLLLLDEASSEKCRC